MSTDDVDDVVAASHLFDYTVRAEWASRFLEDPRHHLCVAYVEGEPAGMVTGVEMTHPDKGTEMFLYELGVDERFRGEGVGKAWSRRLPTLRTGEVATGCGSSPMQRTTPRCAPIAEAERRKPTSL